MELYSDKNKKTTLKGLGFKNKEISKNTIKRVEEYFKLMYEKQKIPGNTHPNTLPSKFLNSKTEAKKYYNVQSMYRILAMRNRAKSMLERVKNEDSKYNLNESVKIFDKWLNNYKIKGGTKYVDCCNHTEKDNKCQDKCTKKVYSLPRRFTKEDCTTKEVKGFTMRSSCTPYKNC